MNNQDVSTDSRLIKCNCCVRETRHELVTIVKKARTGPCYDIDVVTTWVVWQCKGCEEVTIHRSVWHSEMDPADGLDEGEFYPPRFVRNLPEWIHRPEVSRYSALLREIYSALTMRSYRLAMMGTRALIDLIIRNSVGDKGNFTIGLDAFVNERLITEKQRDVLISAIDAGHAAAHRSHIPKQKDVEIVLNIIENLIYAEVSVHDAEFLKSGTPKRKTFSKIK